MRWTTDRIRQSFLDFFKERGHTIVPSASLIPRGDPTLLFTNAGMVPFKDYFLALRTPTDRRVADCQKCLRISGKHNDLEAVGRDSYHHTFFEMLGNWSFGDYYKREAIQFHWELITQVWEIPPAQLRATVYKDDDEAEQAWLELGYLPRDRVLRFGEKDNFWEMGESGPCGPCSEIHIDRGAEAAKFCTHQGQPCGVNVDGCARFIELANLVFIQYDRDSAGKLSPLPMKHVDTGTGLERVASVLQSIETGKLLGNYETDVFQHVIVGDETLNQQQRIQTDDPSIQDLVCTVGNQHPYGSDPAMDVSYRAIADHGRAISFLISDGLRPGNSDREYVLRRLIRRAARHARLLGVGMIDRLLVAACQGVIATMSNTYQELESNRDVIFTVVREEEVRFHATLLMGEQYLKNEIHGIRNLEYRRRRPQTDSFRETGEYIGPGLKLSGEAAFKLYDTYGFPLDLTQDILRDDEIEVDVAGFDRLMNEQRERARAARKEDAAIAPKLMLGAGSSSRFIGHHQLEAESEVVASQSEAGGQISIAVAETPFYPEGGGQIGDRGIIESERGAVVEITDTRKHNGAIVHVGRLLRGDVSDFSDGRRVILKVDRARRTAAMLNHSATHLLHYALREVLGENVHQAGSLVEPARLRFDFAHNGRVAPGDLVTIEEQVNARIRENAAVTTEEMPYNDALKAGALAFFGDKYGDVVRVVRMGDFSVELCGGTHTGRTGDVGLFKLESESAVAAGVRRIEAFTGQGAIEAVRRRERLLEEIGDQLGARDEAVLDRLHRLLAREKELDKKIRGLEQKLIAGEAANGTGAEQVRDHGGVKIVTHRVAGVEARALREMADRLRQKYQSAVIAIGSEVDGKAALVVAVSPDLVNRIKAGDIIKQIAPIVGGSGGGRPDFAQAGGRSPNQLGAALEAVAAAIG
ncbi:MAG: alanine--tRNA ligase [Candidatus Binataceae bacterium]|nr:alanine--tRNA ligase [Candidatus Binataceae bacterium]